MPKNRAAIALCLLMLILTLLMSACQRPVRTPSDFTLNGVTYTYSETVNGAIWFTGSDGSKVSCAVLESKNTLVCRINLYNEQLLLTYDNNVMILRDEIENVALSANINASGRIAGLTSTAPEGLLAEDLALATSALHLIRAVDLTVLPALSAPPVNGWLLAIGILLILAGLVTMVLPGFVWALLEARGSWKQPRGRSLLLIRAGGVLAALLGIVLIIAA